MKQILCKWQQLHENMRMRGRSNRMNGQSDRQSALNYEEVGWLAGWLSRKEGISEKYSKKEKKTKKGLTNSRHATKPINIPIVSYWKERKKHTGRCLMILVNCVLYSMFNISSLSLSCFRTIRIICIAYSKWVEECELRISGKGKNCHLRDWSFWIDCWLLSTQLSVLCPLDIVLNGRVWGLSFVFNVL